MIQLLRHGKSNGISLFIRNLHVYLFYIITYNVQVCNISFSNNLAFFLQIIFRRRKSHKKYIYCLHFFQKIIANRPALGVFPGKDWPSRLHDVLLQKEVKIQVLARSSIFVLPLFHGACFEQVAPPGLSHITTMMCGSCSNENAFKNIFIWYAGKQRQGASFTKEEMESCMMNQVPGSPRYSIMSFKGALCVIRAEKNQLIKIHNFSEIFNINRCLPRKNLSLSLHNSQQVHSQIGYTSF